jgi:hypothetical protein
MSHINSYNGSGNGVQGEFKRRNTQSIEEKNFNGALTLLEGHFEGMKIGPKTGPSIKKMVAGTLDKSLNKAEVRYVPRSPLPNSFLQV